MRLSNFLRHVFILEIMLFSQTVFADSIEVIDERVEPNEIVPYDRRTPLHPLVFEQNDFNTLVPAHFSNQCILSTLDKRFRPFDEVIFIFVSSNLVVDTVSVQVKGIGSTVLEIPFESRYCAHSTARYALTSFEYRALVQNAMLRKSKLPPPQSRLLLGVHTGLSNLTAVGLHVRAPIDDNFIFRMLTLGGAAEVYPFLYSTDGMFANMFGLRLLYSYSFNLKKIDVQTDTTTTGQQSTHAHSTEAAVIARIRFSNERYETKFAFAPYAAYQVTHTATTLAKSPFRNLQFAAMAASLEQNATFLKHITVSGQFTYFLQPKLTTPRLSEGSLSNQVALTLPSAYSYRLRSGLRYRAYSFEAGVESLMLSGTIALSDDKTISLKTNQTSFFGRLSVDFL